MLLPYIIDFRDNVNYDVFNVIGLLQIAQMFLPLA